MDRVTYTKVWRQERNDGWEDLGNNPKRPSRGRLGQVGQGHGVNGQGWGENTSVGGSSSLLMGMVKLQRLSSVA